MDSIPGDRMMLRIQTLFIREHAPFYLLLHFNLNLILDANAVLGICFFTHGGEYTGESGWEGEKGTDSED